MKIALLSDLFYPYLLGGGERQFFEIGRRLARKHDVHVFTLRLPGSAKEDFKDGMAIHRGGAVHPLDHRSFYPLLTVPSLFRKIKGFDVVHANQGVSSFFGIFRDAVDRNEKFVATFHDFYIDKWGAYYKFPSSFMGRALEFFWEKSKYDDIIVPSPATQEKLEFFGMRSTVIPNGIEFDKYKIRKKEKTILYVGRLVKYKHVDELIRASVEIQRRYGYRIKIIGQGEEMGNLKRLTKSIGADVQFLGFVSDEVKIDELSRAEIFVNPSTVEGFGIAVLEALASGCKVVAKRLPAYYFCKNTAILTDDIKSGLRKAIDWKPSKAKLRNSVRKFSWNSVAKEVEKIYFDRK